MPKPKAKKKEPLTLGESMDILNGLPPKKRDRSTESRITRAICLPHATDKALADHAKVADRSVSWCVNKAITEYLKTCAAVQAGNN